MSYQLIYFIEEDFDTKDSLLFAYDVKEHYTYLFNSNILFVERNIKNTNSNFTVNFTRIGKFIQFIVNINFFLIHVASMIYVIIFKILQEKKPYPQLLQYLQQQLYYRRLRVMIQQNIQFILKE